MAKNTASRSVVCRVSRANLVGAIASLILLGAGSTSVADDGPGGLSAAPQPAPAVGDSDIVHYRLIRLPEGAIPSVEDFVGTLDVPRAYIRSVKPPAGSTQTALGLETEA